MNASPELYRRHRLSVEDYHRMGEAGIFAPDARVELIDGEIIDKAPIGKRHMGKVDRLNRLLVQGVGERGIVRVQGSIRLSDFSEPEPDLVLLKPRDDFYESVAAETGDVLLLIEVASSSLRYDTSVKLPLYAERGVPEVWIVDVEGRRLRRHADPHEGRWRFEDSPTELGHIVPRYLDDVSLDLSTLF